MTKDLLQTTQRPQNNQPSCPPGNQKVDSVMFNKTQNDKSKNQKICRYCHKKGHVIEDCYKKKKVDGPKKGDTVEKSNFIGWIISLRSSVLFENVFISYSSLFIHSIPRCRRLRRKLGWNSNLKTSIEGGSMQKRKCVWISACINVSLHSTE